MIRWRTLRTALTLALPVLASTVSAFAQTTTESCLEAHSQGQDAREQGTWSVARQLFVTCARPGCPELVRADCATLADELQRYQPWVSFAARDDRGRDLPDTAVYVDGALVATQLDGRAHELDPGTHVVRFVHGDGGYESTIVIGEGEKGRVIVATFELSPAADSASSAPRARARAAKATLGSGVRALVGVGSALLATGAALAITGLARVPGNCSLSSHECAGPPDDPAIDRASRAVRLSNVGWALAGTGAAALAGGLIWHFERSKARERVAQVVPWASPTAAGIALSGWL